MVRDKDPDAWRPREGEPTLKIETRGPTVIFQSLAVGVTALSIMRPAVARWAGEQLIKMAAHAESDLIVPGGVNGGKRQLPGEPSID